LIIYLKKLKFPRIVSIFLDGRLWRSHLSEGWKKNFRHRALGIISYTIVLSLMLIVGFVGGRISIQKHFRSQIILEQQGETLGGLLDMDPGRYDVMRIAKAYYDPEFVRNNLYKICWSVPNASVPFVGHAPQPGQYTNASINSWHFRSNKEVFMPKPSGVFRIFLTGGSTAFGCGAPSQDRTIGSYLEKILNSTLSHETGRQYEVFTVAAPGWSSTHERIMTENVLAGLDPDLVIALSGINDAHWGWRSRNVLWYRSYKDELFKDLLNQAYKTAGFAIIADEIKQEDGHIAPEIVAQRLKLNVELSLQALKDTHAQYVFARQPARPISEYRKLLNNGGSTERNADQALWSTDWRVYMFECGSRINRSLSEINHARFTYIDLSKIFDGEEDFETIFLDSYHFGDRGNERIARYIADHLQYLTVVRGLALGPSVSIDPK
jgi:hypothetical protein